MVSISKTSECTQAFDWESECLFIIWHCFIIFPVQTIKCKIMADSLIRAYHKSKWDSKCSTCEKAQNTIYGRVIMWLTALHWLWRHKVYYICSIGYGGMKTNMVISWKKIYKRMIKQTAAYLIQFHKLLAIFMHKMKFINWEGNHGKHQQESSWINIYKLQENKNFIKTHSKMSQFINYLSFRSACPRFTNVGSHISFCEDEVWPSVNSNNWTAFG